MSNFVHTRWFARQPGVILGLLFTATCLMTAPVHAQLAPSASGQRNEHDAGTNKPSNYNTPAPDFDATRSLSSQQKQSMMQANFQKSKSGATELAALAKDLCKELNKPNADVLSLGIANRVEKIEKLAKKIRDETKGF